MTVAIHDEIAILGNVIVVLQTPNLSLSFANIT